jgi:hypothetical protein
VTARGAAALLAAGVLAGLTGCSPSGGAPAATPAAPSTAPVTAGDPQVLALGGPLTTMVGDTATAHGSRRSAAGGPGWAAVDAEVCAAAEAGSVGVSAASWRLVGTGGTVYAATQDALAGAPTPRFPDAELVEGGRCLRAWVVFAVPSGAAPARVVYQPDPSVGPLAAWPLQG